MSQATEEKPQLLIDLTNARHATALDASSILHRMQIEAFLDRVSEVVGRVEGFSEKLKQCGDGRTRSVSYERYHDVITLHGKRGSGKTTFLLSALELLQDPAKRRSAFPERFKKDKNKDNNEDGLNGLCVLEILDPTLFGLHEHLLLSLLAKIAFEVRNAVRNGERNLCGGHDSNCCLEEWEKHLRQFAKALKHMGETRDDLDGDTPKETVQWDDAEFIFEQNMESAKRSFGLEREFHKFLNESLHLIGKKAFVLALDDIDTRPQIGWHVLEVLRRYFTSPQLVVVLSGDMDLFKTIIEKQQLKIFDLNFDSKLRTRNEFKARVDELTEQYLLKVLRTPSRISLGSFRMALQQWKRISPDMPQKIGKLNSSMCIEQLLKSTFFSVLACHRGAEQHLFRQTLFSNPARTVTQILDVLWDSSTHHPRYKEFVKGDASEYFFNVPSFVSEQIVSRFREVFLVSLQNIGFERPFDFAEVLQSSHGVNLFMKQLFVRGYTATGLDLLPTRQNPDENNALLALNVELTQAMLGNPAVLLSYALKACLLREVLMRSGEEIDAAQYKKYETFLCLETEELVSVTAARISTLLWGHQPNNTLKAMGAVRLYGRSITKNAPAAVRAMYGMDISDLQDDGADNIPQELQGFCQVAEEAGVNHEKLLRRWINTPETLRATISSWHRDIIGLGVIDVRSGDGFIRSFSIFPLLAAMCDFLESAASGLPNLLAQYSQVQTINAFVQNGGNIQSESEMGDEEEEGGDEENSGIISNEIFVSGIEAWAAECGNLLHNVESPSLLCTNIMNRFFRALARIDDELADKSTYVGVYVNRCLVAFFNSVLVEEFLLKNEIKGEKSIFLDNPVNKDDVFLKNLFSSKALSASEEAYSSLSICLQGSSCARFSAKFKQFDVENGFISDEYPLFRAVFLCPLWALYLKPEEDSNDEVATTVYDIYMRSLFHDKQKMKAAVNVMYGERGDFNSLCNYYYLLNSLAIPKIFRTPARATETRSEYGRLLGLPLNPKSLKRKSIISHPEIRAWLLKNIENSPEATQDDLAKHYSVMVESLYEDKSVISRLSDTKLAEEFWEYCKKNLKP